MFSLVCVLTVIGCSSEEQLPAKRGYISFVTSDGGVLNIAIDGAEYHIKSISKSEYKANKHPDMTRPTHIAAPSGRRCVKVWKGGKVVYDKKVMVVSGKACYIKL
ncbi:MAG: hypothetical protein KBT04_03030 [Bacteroidales bacterium]|nr:hypothetical protein [Candidatus Colimorpha onthohippi]